MTHLLIALAIAAPPQYSLPTAPPQFSLDTRPERWPSSLPFPSEMKPYKRGKYTQSIYTTSGFTRHFIDPVPRFRLLAKWRQSGGMEGVSDFRSDLYRYFPSEPEAWIGDIQVWNGSNYQTNRGWKVLFPDGSKFMDVLSSRGTVFEVRQREKKEGKWTSLVAYEDVAARPKGYTGLTVSCNSCHSEAGSGSYGVGLIPGGDGVLSVGFRALEVDDEEPVEVSKPPQSRVPMPAAKEEDCPT